MSLDATADALAGFLLSNLLQDPCAQKCTAHCVNKTAVQCQLTRHLLFPVVTPGDGKQRL